MPTTISGTTGVSQIQDGTVATADIADDAITNAKVDTIAATKLTGTIADARFPTTLPAASGANLTALPAGNLTGTVADARISALTASKLTGALPAISGANLTGLADNTPAFMAERSGSNQTLSDATWAKCEFNTQTFSTGGTYDNSTNFRWTPGTAGKYYISASAMVQAGEAKWRNGEIKLYKNGSAHEILAKVNTLTAVGDTFSLNGSIIDTANTTDYYEVYVYIDNVSGTPYLRDESHFTGFLVGGA